MDDELYKQKLSEVAEWKIPETQRETADKPPKRGRGRPTTEELYQEAREQIFNEEFDGINRTVAPLLLNIKFKDVKCECGRITNSKCEREFKLYSNSTRSCWREKCVECKMSRNPYTGEFNLDGMQASVVWNSYMKDSKGINKSKGNLAKGIITKDSKKEVYENDRETITYFHDSKSVK